TMESPLFPASFMRKLEMLSLVSRRIFAGKTRGERRSARRGGSVEFSDYLPYAPGDDFRAIDWNAYARLEHLFLKLFVEEEDLSVHIVLDCSRSMAFGGAAPGAQTKLALGKRLAGALAYIALASYDRASVAAFGAGDRAIETTPLLRGKGRIFRIFDFLERISPREGAVSLDAALRTLVERHRPRPGVIVLITDLLDQAGYEEGLKRLRYGPWEPLLLHVLSPEELDPPRAGDHRLIDSEAPGRAVEVSLDGRAIAAYRKRLLAFLAHAEGFCRRHAIGYVRTSSAVELEDLVLRTLRAARFVA
ncbi:MAG: DUF58 domain-containing protein, partial [Polyangiaceae bacterium]